MYLELCYLLTGHEIKSLIDTVYQRRYKAGKNEMDDTGLDEIHMLGDDRVLSSHFDHILRVWNLNTGECQSPRHDA